MMIDENILTIEREKLAKEFDDLKKKITQIEVDLGSMRSNLNALHGAVQQTDKLILLCKQKEKKTDEKV